MEFSVLEQEVFSVLEKEVLEKAERLLGDLQTGSVGNALSMVEEAMDFKATDEYKVMEQVYFGNTNNYLLDSAVKNIASHFSYTELKNEDEELRLQALISAVCHRYLFNSVNKVLFKGVILPGGVFDKYMEFDLNKLMAFFVYKQDSYTPVNSHWKTFLENLFQVLDMLGSLADNKVTEAINPEIFPSWCFNITYVMNKGFTMHYLLYVNIKK